jgi:tRNA pseudouridine synthase 9
MRPSLIVARPSLKVLQYLLRRGRIPASNMALVAVDPPTEQAEVLLPPPKIVTTPCDPWPRPYIIDGNLRRVTPYHFTYNTNCKQRWRGRGILDIFQDEFRDRPLEYYVGALYEGGIIN